jgi:flagellar hook-associated protein 3 FlgL
MRVSNRFLYYQLVKDLGDNSEKLFRLNGQISSAKKLDKPSEDPLGLSKVLVNRTELNAFDQFKKAITLANGWLARTDSITQETDTLLSRASSLAVQMSSSTQTQSTRIGAAEEIKEIREEIMGLANSKYGNKYLFSGTMTQSIPFLDTDVSQWQEDVTDMLPISATPPATPANGDQYIDTDTNHSYTYNTATTTWVDQGAVADGSRHVNSVDGTIYQLSGATWLTTAPQEGFSTVVTNAGNELYVYNGGQWTTQYQGNGTTFSMQIGKGDTVEINIPGSELFRNSTGDVFLSLMNLERALRRNDLQGIRDGIEDLGNASAVLNNKLSKVGAVVNRLDNTTSIIEQAIVDNKATTSDIEDLDYADAITQLQNQQTIYQAALKSASMITSMSLVDYMP